MPARYRTPTADRGGFASTWRGGFARGHSLRKQVVGQLGQLMRAAAIYRGRSNRTATLTTAPAGTFVAVEDRTPAWCAVLMADGSTGWTGAANVRLLNSEVEANVTVPTGADPGDVYPRTATPFFTGDPRALLNMAYRYLGVPYVWGGNTARGIDCSGFVKNVFGALGYALPRLGSDQMAYGVPVPMAELASGDRLYFGRRHDRLGVEHTAIYIGNGYFIHASSRRRGVAIDRLDDPFYARIYVCARR